MRAILSGVFALIVGHAGSEAAAQFSMDTTRFSNPVRVEGAIPGLYKWANSPQSDSADVTILAPTNGQRFKVGDSIFVTVSVSGVAIGAQSQHADLTGLANSTEGQYTGIILDNEPCLTNYKSGMPFFVGLATPGTHTLRIFASRSWHESIKSPGSLKTLSFLVGDDATPETIIENNSLHSERPLLTWNGPKDEYVGKDAKAIMLDFLVTNASLGSESYKVRLTIDGASALLTEWVPYLVTDLKPGAHSFKLQLVSPEGSLVGGASNQMERSVGIK